MNIECIFSKQTSFLLREKLELVSFPLQGFIISVPDPPRAQVHSSTLALPVFVLVSMTVLSCKALCAGRDAVEKWGNQ